MGSLFLHPALLWGLLALAVPILLHFLFRRPEQRIRWAAMDLLRRAVETTAKRSRRRERWLLALRIAVLALLALAFASPLVRDSGVLRVLGADGAPVVLVIDGSLSMQARAATGESAFETARARAIDVVRSTPRGSPTSVVLACAAPRVVVRDEVSRDEVEAALRSLQGTSLGDDDAATARLVDSLAQGARTIWFSDFAGRDRGAAFPAERLSVAVSDSGNAAIESLDVAREPGIAGPLRVTAVVRRFGPARQREISLGVDGVEKERRRIDLAENEVARVTFDLAVDDPGFHEVRAQLDADTRPFDDARSSVIHVRAPLRVRVFEPVGASPHLDAALRAVGVGEIVTSPPDTLDRTPAGAGEIWVLSGIASFGDAAQAVLGAAGDAGVALLWFVEPGTAAGESMPGIPLTLLGAREAPATEPAHLAPVDPDHPLLRSLLARVPAALERVGVRRWTASRLADGSGADVVARIEPSGDPAIVEKHDAHGRAIAFLVPANPSASDLPLPLGGGHAFVPLLAAALERLAPPAPLVIERRCGEPHGLGRDGGDASLVDRDGAPIPLARFADLAPGIYRLISPRLAAEGRVVIAADSRESDVGSAAASAIPPAALPATIAAGFPLLALVAGLLVLEAGLAYIASREERSR